MADYKPKYDFGYANPNAADTPEQSAGELDAFFEWETAPSTSHVHSWRFFDARQLALMKRFPVKQYFFTERLFNDLGQGRSVLEVRFKDKFGGFTDTYVYFFQSPDAGQEILRKLRGSPRPYQEVIRALLINGGIPYSRR